MSDEAPKRPRPSTVGGKLYLVVIAIGAVGLTLVAAGPWRAGVITLGLGLLLAASARGVLSDYDSGMLRVRSRLFDVVALTAVGGALILLAIVIPNQPA